MWFSKLTNKSSYEGMNFFSLSLSFVIKSKFEVIFIHFQCSSRFGHEVTPLCWRIVSAFVWGTFLVNVSYWRLLLFIFGVFFSSFGFDNINFGFDYFYHLKFVVLGMCLTLCCLSLSSAFNFPNETRNDWEKMVLIWEVKFFFSFPDDMRAWDIISLWCSQAYLSPSGF